MVRRLSEGVVVVTAQLYGNRLVAHGCCPTGYGPGSSPRAKGSVMATGETGFDDVTYDLISVQYHSLKAGHDYGQYVRDAENADKKEIAEFFRQVMAEDSARAHKCHEFLSELGGTDNTRPQNA
jgi:hypothetical protein